MLFIGLAESFHGWTPKSISIFSEILSTFSLYHFIDRLRGLQRRMRLKYRFKNIKWSYPGKKFYQYWMCKDCFEGVAWCWKALVSQEGWFKSTLVLLLLLFSLDHLLTFLDVGKDSNMKGSRCRLDIKFSHQCRRRNWRLQRQKSIWIWQVLSVYIVMR